MEPDYSTSGPNDQLPDRHPSTLFMTASPIGNLRDITLRALDVLRACDAIACEDTRHTRILLQYYGITKKLLSCRADNEEASAMGIVKLLSQGQMLAYLSDAGTPGLSDPGSRLVRIVREAGYPVLPLPGPTALGCLLSVNPFGGRSFTFDGFLPVKSVARERRLRVLLDREEAFVFYESPHRIEAVLTCLAELAPDRPMLLGREMTKKFEEYLSGTAEEILNHLRNHHRIMGEFVVYVGSENRGKGGKTSKDDEVFGGFGR